MVEINKKDIFNILQWISIILTIINSIIQIGLWLKNEFLKNISEQFDFQPPIIKENREFAIIIFFVLAIAFYYLKKRD